MGFGKIGLKSYSDLEFADRFIRLASVFQYAGQIIMRLSAFRIELHGFAEQIPSFV